MVAHFLAVTWASVVAVASPASVVDFRNASAGSRRLGATYAAAFYKAAANRSTDPEHNYHYKWAQTPHLRHPRTTTDCPTTYVYDLPDFWDESFPLSAVGGLNATEVFGEPCDARANLSEFGFNTQQYAAPMIVLWRLLNRNDTSKRCAVTKDPKLADLFLVPLYPRPKNQEEWDKACRHGRNTRLEPRLEHLNTKTAHRHVIIVGKGQINPNGACDHWWRSPPGLLKRSSRFAYSNNVLPADVLAQGKALKELALAEEPPLSPGSDEPWRYGPTSLNDARAADAITPSLLDDNVPYPHLLSIPYPAIVHVSRAEMRRYAKGGSRLPWSPAREPRETLVAFMGGTRHGRYSGIRAKLRADCEAAPECEYHHLDELKAEIEAVKATTIAPFADKFGLPYSFLAEPFGVADTCHLLARFKSTATFCLEPGGDSPYRKSIFDSILLGCVPVVFSEYTNRVAPAHWGPFRAKSRVLVDEAAYAAGTLDLVAYLRAIPPAKVAAMQRAVAQQAHRLMYALDDVPRDAVENILLAAHHLATAREREKVREMHAKSAGNKTHKTYLRPADLFPDRAPKKGWTRPDWAEDAQAAAAEINDPTYLSRLKQAMSTGPIGDSEKFARLDAAAARPRAGPAADHLAASVARAAALAAAADS